MTPLEGRFADRHRQTQIQLAALTVIQLQGLWRLLNPDNLAASIPAWTGAALRLIIEQHARSSAAARNYIRTIRSAALGAPPAGTLPVPELDPQAVRVSLIVTGPVRIERAQRRGTDPRTALVLAAAESARAGSRLALAGGRDTITQYTATDRHAGWRRITSVNPCQFCSTLAGRGSVYSNQTVSFPAHDGCRCSAALEYN